MRKLKCEKCKKEYWLEDIWSMKKIDWEFFYLCRDCRKEEKRKKRKT